METFIVTLLVGILIVVMGIVNMTGNISTLHSYHRKRVTEANRKPFGRQVGLGTVIIGVAIIAFGSLMFAYDKTQAEPLVWIATAELIVGLVVGTIISFGAMIKYNGGIF